MKKLLLSLAVLIGIGSFFNFANAEFVGFFVHDVNLGGLWTNADNILDPGDSTFATLGVTSGATATHRFEFQRAEIADTINFKVRYRTPTAVTNATRTFAINVCGENLDAATCVAQDKLLGSGQYLCLPGNQITNFTFANNANVWNESTGIVYRDSGTNDCVSKFTTDFPDWVALVDVQKSGGGTATMQVSELSIAYNRLPNVTRIVRNLAPVNASIEPLNTVTIRYSYNYNDSETPDIGVATVVLQDITNGASIVPIDQTIDASGSDTYEQTYNLNTGATYTWTPRLISTTTGSFVSGDTYSFSVLSQPEYLDFLNEVSTSTASTSLQSSILQFVSLSGLIQSKWPVSYLPQALTLLSQNATLSGAEEFPSLTFEFPNYDNTATVTIEAFSTTTIVGSMDDGVLNTMRMTITYVIWISLIWFLIYDILKMFKPRTT